jgi:hypothetical protein
MGPVWLVMMEVIVNLTQSNRLAVAAAVAILQANVKPEVRGEAGLILRTAQERLVMPGVILQ